jgi:SAM-dependent methyltransferase
MAVSVLASRAWDREEASHGVSWWSSPTCQAYYNRAVCGEPVTAPSEGCRVVLRKALKGRKLDRGVSVGCGAGLKEIYILQEELVQSFDLWEIAPNLADEGRQNAAAAGVADRITYHLGDAFAETAEATYDLVNWDHSLHHMSDVDAALAWSVKVLKPGGFILINDYIGPNRLQFTRNEVERANAFLAQSAIDHRLGRSSLFTKLRQWYRDPSEAPQSELIAEAVKRRLPGAELTPIGGTLLNMLGGTVVPFAKNDDAPVVTALTQEDAKLKNEGYSHFAFALWQKA